MLPRAELLASLPRKRVSAAALVRDDAGRVLLVEPTYRPDHLLPGGAVESDEPPRGGAAREVLEELGVPLPIGRPLVMQWQRTEDDPDGVLHFAYDGGVVDAATIARFRLPPEELRSFRFVEPEAVPALANRSTSTRVAAGLEALHVGSLIELA